VEIVRLSPDRYTEASVVLARAFQDDPAWCWVLPDRRRRQALLPWLFRVAFEATEAQGWTTSGELVGCARWFEPGPPAVHFAALLRALVLTPLRLRGATRRFLAYGRAVETLRLDTVSEPHWYLAGLGVDPRWRRQGIGARLLQPGIDASRRDGAPCVLLTNTETNIPFYARHGFEVIRAGSTPPGGPPAWVMRRKVTV
jgi:ribosomal protein S18 acetylase RimI-like enzyme